MPEPVETASSSATARRLDRLMATALAICTELGMAFDLAVVAYAAHLPDLRDAAVEAVSLTANARADQSVARLRALVDSRGEQTSRAPASTRSPFADLEAFSHAVDAYARAHGVSPGPGHALFLAIQSDPEIRSLMRVERDVDLIRLECRLFVSAALDCRVTTSEAHHALLRATETARAAQYAALPHRLVIRELLRDRGQDSAALTVVKDFITSTDAVVAELGEEIDTDGSGEVLRWDPRMLTVLRTLTPTRGRELIDTADVLLAIAADLPPATARVLAHFGMTSTLLNSAAVTLCRAAVEFGDRTPFVYADRWREWYFDEVFVASPEQVQRRRMTTVVGRGAAGSLFSLDGSALSIRRSRWLLAVYVVMQFAQLGLLAVTAAAAFDKRWWAAALLLCAFAVSEQTAPRWAWMPLQIAGACAFPPWSIVAVLVRLIAFDLMLRATLQQRRVDSVNPRLTRREVLHDMRVSARVTRRRGSSIYFLDGKSGTS